MTWQLDIIMVCVCLLAIDPAIRLKVAIENWFHRQAVHRRSKEQ